MAVELEPLLGRTLVLVAHPDDECVTCGGLLQQMRDPVVVYATDGAPQDPYFWKKHGSREAYSRMRQVECRRALAEVGVQEIVFLANQEPRLIDQELFQNLAIAYELLVHEARRLRPEAILTMAYEGGHPDHDSCSLLAKELSHDLEIPAWEAPLYRRKRDELSVQEFLEPDGTEITYSPTPAEIVRKRAMCVSYPSQGDFLQVFGVEREIFRPQKQYDYSRPPHEGKLNYEVWQWSMTGTQVSERFVDFQRARKARAIAD
ncbi:MAG TPA: PIG-L family deacetylase [Terriglobales bacterium]|nr:PIG-L family deacetylase [Terriglobales bacterium]